MPRELSPWFHPSGRIERIASSDLCTPCAMPQLAPVLRICKVDMLSRRQIARLKPKSVSYKDRSCQPRDRGTCPRQSELARVPPAHRGAQSIPWGHEFGSNTTGAQNFSQSYGSADPRWPESGQAAGSKTL